jgi:hypothetical protein
MTGGRSPGGQLNPACSASQPAIYITSVNADGVHPSTLGYATMTPLVQAAELAQLRSKGY